MANDYYSTLGVSKSANAEEIKRAYRKLALQYHPDRGGGKEAEKKFKEINEAYQVLSDTNKKSQYDQFGHANYQQASNGGGGFDFSGFRREQGDNFGGFDFGFGGGLGDIFEDFFGQAFSQVQAELRISPAQAVLGDKMKLSVDGQNIEISIPAGTQDGTSFRVPGKGRAFKGGKRGDLILTVRIEMPKHISKEQRELWEKLRESEAKKKSWWA